MDVADHTGTNPPLSEELRARIETAFHVAVEKLCMDFGSAETVMQTGEAFGRGVFSDLLRDKTEDWTLDTWIAMTTQLIFNPLGDSCTIADLDETQARTIMTHGALQHKTEEQELVSLFTYSFLRGLLLSAFPNGELLLGSTMSQGAPVNEYTFKISASFKDRTERQRVKNLFTTTKRL